MSCAIAANFIWKTACIAQYAQRCKDAPLCTRGFSTFRPRPTGDLLREHDVETLESLTFADRVVTALECHALRCVRH